MRVNYDKRTNISRSCPNIDIWMRLCPKGPSELPRIYENNVVRRTENSTGEFAIDEMLTGEYLPTGTNGLCASLFDSDDATRVPLRPLASR